MMTEQEAYDNLMGYINEIGTIGVEGGATPIVNLEKESVR